MRLVVRLVFLATAFGLGCVVLGWWSAAPIGVLWGSLARDRVGYAVVVSGGAGLLGWSALLGMTMLVGESGALVASMATLFGTPGFVLPVLTVFLGVLLAVLGTWAGAWAGFPSGVRNTASV